MYRQFPIHGALYLLTGLLIGCAALTESCSRSDEVRTLPRREAFPRIEAYDTIYTTHRVGGLPLQVNAAATVSSPGEGWLDVAYPRYGATMHISVVATPDSNTMAEAVRNRLQRIDLNLGDAPATLSSFTVGDYACRLIVSTEAGRTPVQLLATSPGCLVSATAVLSGTTTPVDSIRPIVEALEAEAKQLLAEP